MRGGRAMILAAGGVGCLLLAAGGLLNPPRRLILNTTASAPLGFYWMSDQAPVVGELALVRPPPRLARWMAMRGYLPLKVPLIKHVAAGGGQMVCGRSGRLSIDGRFVAVVQAHDQMGRRLPGFEGCRRLAADEVFLLNTEAPASLDGRYFGPLSARCVVGRLRPLWTWGR